MFTARKKIAKEKGAEPDVFEESVAQVHTDELGAPSVPYCDATEQ